MTKASWQEQTLQKYYPDYLSEKNFKLILKRFSSWQKKNSQGVVGIVGLYNSPCLIFSYAPLVEGNQRFENFCQAIDEI